VLRKGEVRHNAGLTPTQYSYTGDFGLMFYNARWYDPYITQFSQPDTIIPDLNNPQDWNRYSYARNNPIKYVDPSGHMADDGCGSGEGCDFPDPGDRERNRRERERDQGGAGGGKWWWPFSYDTVGFGAKGLLKEIVGIDGDIMLYWNMKALREWDLQNFDFTINGESGLSAGISGEGAGGVIIYGSKGTVLDQSGFQLIGRDGIPLNVGGCLPIGTCGTGSFTLDVSDPDVVSSASYFVGLGEGVDLSVDIVNVSDWVVYGDPEKGNITTQIPIVNSDFLKTIPILGNIIH